MCVELEVHGDERAPDPCQGVVDVLSLKAVVRHGADGPAAHVAHQNTVFAGYREKAQRLGLIQTLMLRVEQAEIEDIGDDALGSDLDLWIVGQAMCKLLAMLVVLGQSLNHLLKRHDASRRQNA